MHWVALNPNTNAAMTEAVVAELHAQAPTGTTVRGLTARTGCAVIDSRDSFAIGARAALATLAEVPADADAVLLACFGDPGLEALHRASTIPVVGLAEAALHAAHAAGQPYAIVTAGADWVGMLRERAADFGAGRWLVDVYALPANGAALRRDPAAFRAELRRLSAIAAEAGARTLILGGAAFAGLAFEVDARLALMDVARVASAALRDAATGGRQAPGSPTELMLGP